MENGRLRIFCSTWEDSLSLNDLAVSIACSANDGRNSEHAAEDGENIEADIGDDIRCDVRFRKKIRTCRESLRNPRRDVPLKGQECFARAGIRYLCCNRFRRCCYAFWGERHLPSLTEIISFVRSLTPLHCDPAFHQGIHGTFYGPH